MSLKNVELNCPKLPDKALDAYTLHSFCSKAKINVTQMVELNRDKLLAKALNGLLKYMYNGKPVCLYMIMHKLDHVYAW